MINPHQEEFQRSFKEIATFLNNTEDLPEVHHCYRLAKVYYDKADFVSAEKLFLYALDLWELPHEGFFALKTLGFLMKIASEQLNDERVSFFVERAKQIFSLLGECREQFPAEYSYKHGLIESYQGHFSDAKHFFGEAVRLAESSGLDEILVKARFMLATLSFQEGKVDAALNDLMALERPMLHLQKNFMIGNMHLLYGQVYRQQGNYVKALEHFDYSHSFLLGKCCWNLIGRILLEKGLIYKQLGQLNKAQFYFEFALQTINEQVFCRLGAKLRSEIRDLIDHNIDLVIDCTNRIVYERDKGAISFKHRYILLQILLLLARHPGVRFTKEDLVKKVWGDVYHPLMHDQLVYTSVSRLRRLIEVASQKRRYIIRDNGYYTLAPGVKVRFYEAGQLDDGPRLFHMDLATPV